MAKDDQVNADVNAKETQKSIKAMEKAVVALQEKNNQGFAQGFMDMQNILKENVDAIKKDPVSQKVSETLLDINKQSKTSTKLEQVQSKKQLASIKELVGDIDDQNVKELLEKQLAMTESNLNSNTGTLTKGFELLKDNIADLGGVMLGAFSDSPIVAILASRAGQVIKDSIAEKKRLNDEVKAIKEEKLVKSIEDGNETLANLVDKGENSTKFVQEFQQEMTNETNDQGITLNNIDRSLINIAKSIVGDNKDLIDNSGNQQQEETTDELKRLNRILGNEETRREDATRNDKMLQQLEQINEKGFEETKDSKKDTGLKGIKGTFKKVFGFVKKLGKLAIVAGVGMAAITSIFDVFNMSSKQVDERAGQIFGDSDKSIFSQIGNTILAVFRGIGDNIASVFGIDLSSIGDDIGKKIFTLIDEFSLAGLGQSILNGIQSLGNNILGLFDIDANILGTAIGLAVSDMVESVKSFFNNIIENIKNLIPDFLLDNNTDDQQRIIDQQSQIDGGQQRKEIRNALIQKGIIKDDIGDDSIDIQKLTNIANKGLITSEQLRLLLSKGDIGTSIDQKFQSGIANLVEQTKRNEIISQANTDKKRVTISNQNGGISNQVDKIDENKRVEKTTLNQNVATNTNIDNSRNSRVIIGKSAGNPEPVVNQTNLQHAY